ncbi:HNH endonuclease signature motif containing protein [Mangrovibacterium diazotrophicum]|uniref:HNH endonuclease n=1 Tax=Mangrovibacterium diazotrophicum TaxID=1261403 RepID=A0A419W4N9_9BACT|nr:HNH endonuclease signature motif containing protein [Mangrovibacterium diazotrophicum]RKD90431.1 hypothetical protein BC643_0770 [Mangrovibacterium diazotrophicum]
MLFKYSYVSHASTEDFYKEVQVVFKNLWRERNNLGTFSLTTQLFTSEQIKTLRKSKKFKQLLENFINNFLQLEAEEQKEVLRAFIWENTISSRLSDINTRILCKEELPSSIRDQTKELFYYLYKERFRKKYLNTYYPIFYNRHRNRYCPFCGLEKIPAANSNKKREYDHILPKSIYPFAAVNLKNLAPSCIFCNEDAKKDKDIIFSTNINGAKRRRAYDYVYDGDLLVVDIRIENRTVFPNANGENSDWILTILPDEDKTRTWDEVFCIKERYIEYLDQHYNDWIKEAVGYCLSDSSLTDLEIKSSIVKMLTGLNTASNDNMESKLKLRFYELISSDTNSIPFQTIQTALNL